MLVNKSYHFAIERFNEACLKQFGIKPIDDDKLILKSFIDFGTCIKSYKRLDHTVKWHKMLIDSMVKVKLDTLNRRIEKEYGTHKKYFSRL